MTTSRGFWDARPRKVLQEEEALHFCTHIPGKHESSSVGNLQLQSMRTNHSQCRIETEGERSKYAARCQHTEECNLGEVKLAHKDCPRSC